MRLLFAIVAAVAAFASTPAFAAACAGFTDVDSGNSTYCAAVTYMKDKGITLGCTGTAYCPNEYVTRLQMAIFLQRLGQGGKTNTVDDTTNTVGGGALNQAIVGLNATVAGGYANHATYDTATVGGGGVNTASGTASTVVGGDSNSATNSYSTVIGGLENTASGVNSLAGGSYATADATRCIAFSFWSNSSPGMGCLGEPYIFRVGGNHGFSIDYFSKRADGGGTEWVAIGDTIDGQTIATWTGGFLSNGGTWTNSSDRNVKSEFKFIDTLAVLQKVADMPISEWRYNAESDQRHVGPMAQDFYAAFQLGADDKHIATIDGQGIALAAIQGLNAKLERENAELRARIDRLEAMAR